MRWWKIVRFLVSARMIEVVSRGIARGKAMPDITVFIRGAVAKPGSGLFTVQRKAH